MAPHSSTLAWKIPWTEDPGRLQSMGSRRVGHDFTFTFHFSLSCIGEGNGNPLQCSCLENPRDGGAWWNLKRLSSSSSSSSDSNGKESACQCRRHRFDPWKIPWRRHDNPIQYSCLENPMDRGAWWATIHRVTKSWIQLRD